MAEHCLHQVIRFATQLEKKIVPPELKAIREAQMAFNWGRAAELLKMGKWAWTLLECCIQLRSRPHNAE